VHSIKKTAKKKTSKDAFIESPTASEDSLGMIDEELMRVAETEVHDANAWI